MITTIHGFRESINESRLYTIDEVRRISSGDSGDSIDMIPPDEMFELTWVSRNNVLLHHEPAVKILTMSHFSKFPFSQSDVDSVSYFIDKLASDPNDVPPIVLDVNRNIIDGRHRFAAMNDKNIRLIRVFLAKTYEIDFDYEDKYVSPGRG